MSILRDFGPKAALAAVLLGGGLAACNPAGDDPAPGGTPTALSADPGTALPAPATVPAYPGAAEGRGSAPAAGQPGAAEPGRGSTGAITGTGSLSETDAMTAGSSSAVTDTEGAASHDALGLAALSARAPAGPSLGLAGDPLSAAEMDRARQLALGGAEVRGMLAAAADRDGLLATSGRGTTLSALLADRPTYRVLYTQRAPEKESDQRMAEIAVYRYDTGEGSVSTVDLKSGAVSSDSVPDSVYLPLVPAETDEAAQVARSDDRVKAQLRAAGLDEARTTANGLLTAGEEDGSPCRRHRCVRLFFSTIDKPVPAFSATVDLVDVSVVEVSPIPMEGVNR